MRNSIVFFLIGIILTVFSNCSSSDSKEIGANAEKSSNSDQVNRESETVDENNDNRINNAGEAKRPKGKMSYHVNGSLVTIDESTVQCMYVGMNSSMAQSVISGGGQCTIVHMGIPKVGEVKIESIATMPNVGIQVFVDGIQYMNKKASDAKFTLTKVTPDGKNYYVSGTFSGKLTSIDGTKTIVITDGVFESAYL